MYTVRKIALVAAALSSFTAVTATQCAFAQTNRYTRIEASTRYLGPNGLVDRGYGGPVGRFGFAPGYGQRGFAYQDGDALGGSGPFFGNY